LDIIGNDFISTTKNFKLKVNNFATT